MTRLQRVVLLVLAGVIVACGEDGAGDGVDDAGVDAQPDVGVDDAASDAEAGDDTDDGAAGDAADAAEDAADGSGDAPPEVDVEPPPDPLTASWCYRESQREGLMTPDYDQFEPTVGSHCLGTNQQDIQGVEKVVFVGDSVTVGTPPTFEEDYYRNLVVDGLRERFGADIVVESYAEFGARVDDLILPPHQQLVTAFPDVEPLRTLVVFTIGGNDIFAWASDAAEGAPIEQTEADVDRTIGLFEDVMEFLDDDARFPAGVFVVFANAYEYTDGTGDTASCSLASAIGLGAEWEAGRAPVVRFNEAYMRLAVEHQFDMLFLLEHFCGHGFHYDDPEGQCYQGPDAEQWFDFTCIHPNPTGHREIANMVLAVVDE
ncbi:MAG: SGNH/GDSL hydrolase family protein [Myxococcales bacterium]|nr:SGNH/GDSL hydrolase family protein [Myxococcales bacterium]MCB9534256.1 SGNH/GDSL hydrolase family protein [Myxococcales bacterium]